MRTALLVCLALLLARPGLGEELLRESFDGGAAARFVVRLVAGLQDFPESELKI